MGDLQDPIHVIKGYYDHGYKWLKKTWCMVDITTINGG
jgi:hypothetical protein